MKAYPTGRYEDPNDPSVMHEAHVLYRAEQPPSWNLNPTVDTAVSLGPTVTVTNGVVSIAFSGGNQGSGYINPALVIVDPVGTGSGAGGRAAVPLPG